MTERNIKIIGMIIGVLLFIALVSGLTYAYYNSATSASINGEASCLDISYSQGSNIGSSVNAADVIILKESDIINNNKITVKNGMAITNFSIGLTDSSCNIKDAYITVNADVASLNTAFKSSGNSYGAYKYAIASYSTNTYPNPSVTTSDLNNISFDILSTGSITQTGNITIYTGNIPYGSKNDYLVIFYIDGDMAMNDAQNANFSATITVTATQGMTPTF